MLPVLDKLTQDDDSDVRYFSDEAIASVKWSWELFNFVLVARAIIIITLETFLL